MQPVEVETLQSPLLAAMVMQRVVVVAIAHQVDAAILPLAASTPLQQPAAHRRRCASLTRRGIACS
ncbi:hypothetical protein V6L77_00825 [Pannonibacter sp. Pt2-lr]